MSTLPVLLFGTLYLYLKLLSLLNVAFDIIFRYASNEVEHSPLEFCS